MKKVSKIIVLFLMVILLVACGKDKSGDDSQMAEANAEISTENVDVQETESIEVESTESENSEDKDSEVEEQVTGNSEGQDTGVSSEAGNANKETPTEEVENEVQKGWVADLDVAQSASQIIVVAAEGNTATVSMHNKNADGSWTQILSTSASIGKNGIGKTQEGDGKTPRGQYAFTFGFGIKANPGTALSYTQVDDSYYWVDDSASSYYNQFVSTNNVTKDWNSAEHILGAGSSYNYVLAINYNSACTPGAGSAIFMHCKPTGGAGCIAVSESSMITIMQNVQPGCVLIIDTTTGVYGY